MAFIAKQQSLKQWAELVSGTEVHSLSQIQNAEFTSQLLLKLDPDYFKPIIAEHLTLTQLFTQITKYYSSQIGTNIHNIMAENINIYSSSSIEQVWELVLGIAIKGKNREKNINTILRMRTQTQQQLMRIISKLINKLGENVSYIENSASQIPTQPNNYNASNDTGILIELSQQNQQLRQKLEELSAQLTAINEKSNAMKIELQMRDKQRKEIINIMVKQPISAKSGFIYSAGSGDSVVQFVKDLIAQVNFLTKELNKKQQKQVFYEDVNKDLKLAYTTIFMQLEDMKNASNEAKVDIKEVQKQIQQLRTENLDYAERERELLSKISDLEEQKFYLKGVVGRLEAKNAQSQQKMDRLINNKAISSNLSNGELLNKLDGQGPVEIKIRYNDSFIESTQVIGVVEQDKQKTVRNEIDQLKLPNQRNRLQRQVNHLQKKLASVQEQNNSLKKINSVLERVINDFTKQSQQIIEKYQSEIQPLFQQLSQTLEEEQRKRRAIEEQSIDQQAKNQGKIEQLLSKIKEKIQTYDNKEIQYQKLIKKLEIEKNQLENSLKLLSAEKQAPQPKNNKSLSGLQVEQKVMPSPVSEKQVFLREVKQPTIRLLQMPKIQETIPQSNIQPEQQMPLIKILLPVETKKEEIQEQESIPKSDMFLRVDNNRKNVAASILMEQEQEQTMCRKRQYSFMGNKQSMQFGNDGELNFKQKASGSNKISVVGSYIEEETHHAEGQLNENLVESLTHVEIIDITQIQEQLMKIKDHYLGLTTQSQKICEDLLKKSMNEQKLPPRQSSLPVMIKNYETLSQMNGSQTQKIGQFIKKFQYEGLQKAQLTTENIKMKNEISQLKKHILNLNKQRKAVEERLNYLHQQSSKSQSQRTKQQLNKLGETIRQIKNIMALTQNNYIEAQQFFCKSIEEGDKRVGALSMEIEELKLQLRQREQVIAQLQLESNLLMGAVLEFRNNTIRSC